MIVFRRALWAACLATLLMMAAPTVVVTARAAEAAQEHATEHEGEGHHAASVGDLLFPAINFAIYLGIIVVYVIPAMREYLRRRRADAVELKAESDATLARAEEGLAASKRRLAALASEGDGIRETLMAIATRQAERVKAQAEETGTRRLADASLQAEQERRRALADLRADLARAAASLAEGRIRGALTADDQRTFVQQFLKDAVAR